MKRLFLALIIAASQSQPPQNTVEKGTSEGQFTLKTSTEVVLVNVTVRDKNDSPIKDLKAQDFTILEDGKKQDIISLDAENTDSVVSAETPQLELLTKLSAPTNKAPTPSPAPTLTDVNELKDRRLI